MNLVALAQRIRQLRQQRQLSVEETSRRAGLTRSWLSKVESFRLTPSLPALASVAEALGVTVAELVEGLDSRPRLVHTSRQQREQLERDVGASDITYELLAAKRTDRKMEPMLLTVPAQGGLRHPLAHPGEEFLHVMEGAVNFEYDGQVMPLVPGDSLYFDGTAPHRLVNPNSTAAQVLCVYYGLAGNHPN